MRMRAIILKGICWSGKSTIAAEYNLPIVNGDTMRLKFPEMKEDEIRDLQKVAVATYASQWSDFVRDNTHINVKTLKAAEDYCKELGYEVEIRDIFAELVEHFWNSADALHECIMRNNGREGKAKVPASVILEMYLNDWYKLSDKPLVLVDLDGTLYNMDHRLHYVQEGKKSREWWGAFESDEEIAKDTVHEPVKDVIMALQESGKYDILLLSGRKNHAHDVTVNNLVRDGLTNTICWLLMRKWWDSRKDSIIKEELLDVILKNHTVAFVLDDRKQVIDMWRKRGLYVMNCCQRESNDF